METQEVSTSNDVKDVKVVSKGNYNSIRDKVEKPFSEREKVPSVRSGLTVHRKYHLTKAQITSIIEKHKAMGGGAVINPHSNRGPSSAGIESLIQLGADEWHSHKTVKDVMEEIMLKIPKTIKLEDKSVIKTDAWTHFQGKASRDGALKPKDVDGKILQNFRVLQRVPKEDGSENNPYGLKLAQFKMCIDIDFRKIASGVDLIPYFRLNTQWKDENVKPIFNKPKKAKKEKVLKAQD